MPYVKGISCPRRIPPRAAALHTGTDVVPVVAPQAMLSSAVPDLARVECARSQAACTPVSVGGHGAGAGCQQLPGAERAARGQWRHGPTPCGGAAARAAGEPATPKGVSAIQYGCSGEMHAWVQGGGPW
mgnify:CR=1 FL=1